MNNFRKGGGLIQSNLDVLIVKDKSADYDAIEDTISSLGCRVRVASTFKDAITKLSKIKTDLIFIDVERKDELGESLDLPKIKESFNIPIIYMVGDPPESQEATAAAASDGYIPKNHDKVLLEETIVNTLYQHATTRRAEVALNESEGKYQDLIQLLPLIVFETDLQGNITFVNEIAAGMTGYSREDLDKGFNLFEIVAPEDYNKALKNFRSVLEGRTSGGIEYIAIKKDGSKFHALVFANAIVHDNKAIGLRGVVLDVTSLKMMEDSIKKSEHRLKQLLNNMANGVTVYEALDDGKDFLILNINRAGERITDVKRSEIQGNRVTEVYPEIENFGLLKVLQRVFKTGEPEHFPLSHYKDHRISIWVENYIYKLPSGEVVAVFDDVSRRKHAEEALRKSERQLNDIINHLPDATFAIDGDGKIIAWNKAIEEMTGIPASQMIDKGNYEYAIPFYGARRPILADLILRSDGEVKETNYGEIKKSGKALMTERYIPKLGKVLWGKASPLYDENGECIGAIESIRDITHQKNAENDIKKTLTEKELLLKEIHHRVKNNLQIISSLLDLQEEYVKEDAEAVNVLHESQNRVMSMALIHELLYQAKDLNKIDFSEYIKNLISHLFDSYGVQNNIIPTIKIGEIFLNIETAVPSGLIISELVSNSLKYAFPDDISGEVLISLQTKGTDFELIIADDGIGFPEGLDFRNVRSSLGLKLVNSLVQQLEGTISMDRNKGTNFRIKFKELKYQKRL